MRPAALLVMLVAIAAGAANAAPPRIALDERDDRVVVTVDGAPFTEYLFKKEGLRRPVLFPIHGPRGVTLTRSWPVGPRLPGDPDDHPHHESFWFAHGDVNGVDFWTGKRGARIEQVALDHVGDGRIEASCRWVGPQGEVVCTDRRVIAFSAEGDDRIIDHAITITASHGPVAFGDTKEGTMALRVRPELNVAQAVGGPPATGHYVNAAGDRDTAVWGRPAAWVDLSGTLDGRPVGIACFDHPANLRHPACWHARDYGLFAANPFGLHDFTGAPQGSGRFELAAGKSLTLRHRWLLHAGDAEAARIAERHAAWAGRDAEPRTSYPSRPDKPAAAPPFFCFVLGSQWLGGLAADQQLAPFLRDRPALHEAHRRMTSLGSDIVKFEPSSRSLRKQGFDTAGYETLDRAIRHPHYRALLDMPGRVVLLWAHGGKDAWYAKGMDQADRAELYREFHDLTSYLLTEYDGSGKTFLIGNWEGDWMAGAKSVGEDEHLADDRVAAFQDWLDVRTQAIDHAKAATPHRDVGVYSYLEVNHVERARTRGLRRLVNTVLPRSRVDYVSVSSYEATGYGRWPKPRTADSLRRQVFDTLSFVEEQLPPRDVPGKRVFIGEIGFTIEEIRRTQKLSPEEADREQARLALVHAEVSLEWGVPLWLWWAIYNSDDGTFALVDQSTGRTSRLYHELETYYAWARRVVREHEAAQGDLPAPDAFRRQAIEQLRRQVSALESETAP